MRLFLLLSIFISQNVFSFQANKINYKNSTITMIGTQTLKSSRTIPFVGPREVTTENIVLAKAKIFNNTIKIHQKVCKIKTEDVFGISISMSEDSINAIPMSKTFFEFDESNGLFKNNQWTIEWDEKDHDGDGYPGISIDFYSSFCKGKLFTSNQTNIIASGVYSKSEGIFEGTLSASVVQKSIGASSFCLRVVAKDTVEKQTGSFKYYSVDDRLSCKDAIKYFE